MDNLSKRGIFFYCVFKLIMVSMIMCFLFFTCFLLIPKNPIFHVENVTLKNFNINSSNSVINGNWDVGLIVRNPNLKVTFYYEEVKVNLFYKSDLVSETSVQPFMQGTMNETNLKATFAPSKAYVNDWGDIMEERTHGMVEFSVNMTVRVRFKGASWRVIRRSIGRVDVHCPSLSIRVPSNSNGGFLHGGSKQCSVN